MKVKFSNLNIPPHVQTFAKELFKRFYGSIRLEYILFRSTVPYVYVWHFFSFYRIGKRDARKILHVWKEMGFVEIVRFHGLRLNEDAVRELLT